MLYAVMEKYTNACNLVAENYSCEILCSHCLNFTCMQCCKMGLCFQKCQAETMPRVELAIKGC